MNRKTFPAKVLLFGEYTILNHSRALATPLPQRYCQWKQGGTPLQQEGLFQLYKYLQQWPKRYHLTQFQQDLNDGWFLTSNIPTGYGLGSSGAVCVAVLNRYGLPPAFDAMKELGEKYFLAELESCFHGSSSGVDPLIIHLNQNVHLFPDGKYEKVEIPSLPDHLHLFLLDTQIARKTAPLVAYFEHRYQQNDFFRRIVDNQWTPSSNMAIDHLLSGQWNQLLTDIRNISQLQYEQLVPMIPPSMRKIWLTGLETGSYTLKLCGAGGGGYCIGISQQAPDTLAALTSQQILTLNL